MGPGDSGSLQRMTLDAAVAYVRERRERPSAEGKHSEREHSSPVEIPKQAGGVQELGVGLWKPRLRARMLMTCALEARKHAINMRARTARFLTPAR
eukprot:gene19781-6928_t